MAGDFNGASQQSVKMHFPTINLQCTSPKHNFQYSYPHCNAFSHCVSLKPHYSAQNVTGVSNVQPEHQPMKHNRVMMLGFFDNLLLNTVSNFECCPIIC